MLCFYCFRLKSLSLPIIYITGRILPLHNNNNNTLESVSKD